MLPRLGVLRAAVVQPWERPVSVRAGALGNAVRPRLPDGGMMGAYAGARGPRVFGVHTFGGVSTHVTMTGVFAWLLVVGVAELAAVSVELAFRLLRFVGCQLCALADWAVKHQLRSHASGAARKALHGFGRDEREVKDEHGQGEKPDGDANHDQGVHHHARGQDPWS
jgi:hypothetical protein